MRSIRFYELSQEILEHLEKDEDETAFVKTKKLLDEYPGNALVWFILGLYYFRKQDVFNAIDSFTRTLRYDPAFVSAAEMLLKLNKDNYSIGELKYIYSLILSYKEGSGEMLSFLQKFADVPVSTELSVPNLGQDDLKADTLPGIDDNEYIQHLINEMDHPKGNEGIPAKQPEKEIAIIPETDYAPPKKISAPALNSNKNQIPANYGIETMTMAKLYVRQGLYEQAMNILTKLQKRDPGSEQIKMEIERVLKLIDEEKKESR